MKRKEGGLIPAAELSGCKPWRLPRVNSGHVVRSPFAQKPSAQKTLPDATAHGVEEELELKPLTVEALEKIRREAREDGLAQGLQEGREQGRQEGLKTGRDEGYRAGMSQAQGEIDALKAQLAGLMAAVQQPLGEQRDELESVLVQLARQTAEAVVNHELNTRPELLRQAVQEALAALPQSEQGLCFMVNPADEALVTEIRERERADWDIYADAEVSRGGFRVKGRHSYLDYSRERRFGQVVEQLLQPAADEPESS